MPKNVVLILAVFCVSAISAGFIRSICISPNEMKYLKLRSNGFSPSNEGRFPLRGGCEAKESDNQEGLISAVKDGHLTEVEKFLSRGASPNLTDSNGMSALLYAAMYGYIDVLEKLTDAGGDFLAKSGDGSTALHLAAYYGQEEMVRYLFKKFSPQLDANIKDSDGSTPLHNAAFKGQYECASELLSNGANVNACQDVDGFSPLHLASANGHKIFVDLLLRNGADTLLCAGDENETAQDVAAREGQWEVLETFLAHTARKASYPGAPDLKQDQNTSSCKEEDRTMVREAAALVWQKVVNA